MKWPTITLGEVATWGSGGTPKRSESAYFGEGVPWLSIADLNDGVVTSAKESLTPLGLRASTAKVVPAGTILVAMYGSIGKLGIAGTEVCTSQAIAFATPDPSRLDAKYLFHYLLAERPRLQRLGRGGTQMNIGQGDLKAWPIPLPPLEVQRHFVVILDQADLLLAQRRRASRLINDLTLATFLQMFGEEARRAVTTKSNSVHPRGWEWVLLTDVARLATGHTPDRKNPEYWNGEIPWISLPEIRALDGRTAFDTELRVTAAGVSNSSAVLLPEDTICFSRTASIGFVAKLGRPMATSQDFHNWVPGDAVNPDYLMSSLRASRPHLLRVSDGSIHQTIYQRVAEGFRLLLPPRELQDLFAFRLSSITELASRLEQAEAQARALREALAARLFLGAM